MDGFELDKDGEERLVSFMDSVGTVLGTDARRASFAVYVMGLIGAGSRKSMEPMASRSTDGPRRVDADHQRIQHFITDSAWDDEEVRLTASQYAIAALESEQEISHWIIDDTGFLKQGKHSPGVKRQYTGSAGKVTNCQVGVSLTVSNREGHVPIDFALYLPKDWTDDPARCQKAKIPK